MRCPFIVENSLLKHHKGDIPSGNITEEKEAAHILQDNQFTDA
jgi:hypothetical protein